MVNTRRFLLPAIGVFAVLVGVLLWQNLSSNLVFYLTPSEAIDQRADFSNGERFRLGGLVSPGTLTESTDGIRFDVDDGGRAISVLHTGTPPQLFKEDIGVVVEGAWVDDEFHSDFMLIRHDEQYRAPDGEGTYQVPEATEG